MCSRGAAKLVTDTESDDVLKERKRARRDSAVPPETAADCIPESVIGGSVRDMTVTAKVTCLANLSMKPMKHCISNCYKIGRLFFLHLIQEEFSHIRRATK